MRTSDRNFVSINLIVGLSRGSKSNPRHRLFYQREDSKIVPLDSPPPPQKKPTSQRRLKKRRRLAAEAESVRVRI